MHAVYSACIFHSSKHTLCWVFIWSSSAPTVQPLTNYVMSLNELGRSPPSNRQPKLSLLSVFAVSMGAEPWPYLRAECDPLHPLTVLSLHSSLSSSWGKDTEKWIENERVRKKGSQRFLMSRETEQNNRLKKDAEKCSTI